MSEDLRTRVGAMLDAHATAALATTGTGGLWAASVFYASDEVLRLVFVTDPGTRHGRNLLEGGAMAATINADVSDWHQIRGLQLEGTAAVVPPNERPAVLQIYLRKFPDVGRLLEAPRTNEERAIGLRLEKMPLWRIEPARIRLLDNRVRFGWKEELVF